MVAGAEVDDQRIDTALSKFVSGYFRYSKTPHQLTTEFLELTRSLNHKIQVSCSLDPSLPSDLQSNLKPSYPILSDQTPACLLQD